MTKDYLTSAGDAKILGIYLDNAGNVFQPQEAVTASGWQARYPQFAVQTTKEGTVAFQVNVDGEDVGDTQIDTMNTWDRQKPHAAFFYLPTKFRTLGTHTITVKVGRVTTEIVTADKGDLKTEKQVIEWAGEYGPFKLTIDQQEEFA